MAPTIAKYSSSKPIPKSKNAHPSKDRIRVSSSAFGRSKKDKRIIKRSALLSRIEKPKTTAKKRRHRPKNLITNLQSLENALPEIANDQSEENAAGNARIKHRSLKSKPGATKKKELLITHEKERFNQNMVQMAAFPGNNDEMIPGAGGPITQGSVEKRWAAIRSFIKQNMELQPDPKVVRSPG